MLTHESDFIQVSKVPIFAGEPDLRPDKSVIFTIAKYDPFLETWLKNNSYLFDDCYVLFHQDEIDKKDRNLCDKYNANIISLNNETSCCWSWITDTINKFSAFLLNNYKLVAYSDVDEIIVDPANRLNNIDSLPEYVRFFGVDIIQSNDELPIDWDKSISQQRRHLYSSNGACKIVAKKRSSYIWDSGQHKLLSEPFDIFKLQIKNLPKLMNNIYLIHLHHIDIATSLERNKRRTDVSSFEKNNELGTQGWANDMSALKNSYDLKRKNSHRIINNQCESILLQDNLLDIIDDIILKCYY